MTYFKVDGLYRNKIAEKEFQKQLQRRNLTKFWYILWCFGIVYNKLVYLMVKWYILWSFGIVPPVLVCFTKKNLATLTDKRSFL
jgi:ABC-type uncharacterized transport system fused permease/ATPase subunit